MTNRNHTQTTSKIKYMDKMHFEAAQTKQDVILAYNKSFVCWFVYSP